MKKLIRTLETNFPVLNNFKYTLARAYRIFFKKCFESDFYALSLYPDSKTYLFLDVGANRGQSIDAILMQTKSGKIYGFEPNTMLSNRLKKLFKNNERITIYNLGLGDTDTTETLNVPFYKKWMFDGLGSFIEKRARNWLKGKIYFYNEKNLHLKKIQAEIKRLDEFNFTPFFIKMDIQGYEYNALKGGIETIKKYSPILLIEKPSEDVVNLLSQLGYSQYAFDNNKFIHNKAGYLNSFFMTDDKAELVGKHIEKEYTISQQKS